MTPKTKRRMLNARPKGTKDPLPSRQDPSRTLSLRRALCAELTRRINRVRDKVVALIDGEDALGLREPAPPFGSVENCAPGQLRDATTGRCGPGVGVDIPRERMPQVRAEDLDDFVRFALYRGVNVVGERHRADDLSPTQREFRQEWVDAIPEDNREPLIVSDDLFILDGTHRWVKAWQGNPAAEVEVMRIALPLEDALELMRAFPEAKFVGNTASNWTAAGDVLLGGVMPGYGQIYFHEATGEAWYVGGDGDERGFLGQVEQVLSELREVRSVRYESEVSPKEDDGWVKVYEPRDSRTVQNTRWKPATSSEKARQFREWVRDRLDEELGDGGDAKDLLRRYAELGFKKGAGRAFDDARRSARGGQSLEFYGATREHFLSDSFARPVQLERIELLAERSYEDLKNVADDAAVRLGRELADGLVEGKGPREIARGLAEELEGSKNRALTVARTEIIRAHADGQLLALERMGVGEVGVQVEWTTAGNPCPLCAEMAGTISSLEEAKGQIPHHPNCRCAWVPYLGAVGRPEGEADAAEKDEQEQDQGATENTNPDQPRDDHGRWTSGGGHPGSKPLPYPEDSYAEDPDGNNLLRANYAYDSGVSLDRISRAEQGYVSRRSADRDLAGDARIVSDLADRGYVRVDGPVGRGLAFDDEAAARAYLDGAIRGGYYKTPDDGMPPSFSQDQGTYRRFANVKSAQVMSPDKAADAHGVVLEIDPGPRGRVRGVALDYGEGEVVLPRGQAYKVHSVSREETPDGRTLHVVKLRHDTSVTTENRWVTLETGQHVWIDDVAGTVHPGGPGSAPAGGGGVRRSARDGETPEQLAAYLKEKGPNRDLPDEARPDLTAAEARAVEAYSGGKFFNINDHLRGLAELDPGNEGVVAGLRSALAKTRPLPEPVTVHRGLIMDDAGEREAFFSRYEKALAGGETVTHKGFVSTTTADPRDDRDPSYKFEEPVRYSIAARRGLDVKPHGKNPDERELLLDHGSRFKVLKVERHEDGGGTVHLEQLL